MFKPIIIIMIILFTGCTINLPANHPQPITEEKKVVEQKKHEPWPEGEKEYWYARYFFTMAGNPSVQQLMLPRAAYEIVKCTVDKYEEERSWKWFVANLHDQKILTPEVAKYVYDTTKFCADIERAKSVKPIPTMDVRDTI